mgnify:CR=1 FL=1
MLVAANLSEVPIALPEAVRGADLVLTGEGTVDAQTPAGKTPAGVARIAGRARRPACNETCTGTGTGCEGRGLPGAIAGQELRHQRPDASQ